MRNTFNSEEYVTPKGLEGKVATTEMDEVGMVIDPRSMVRTFADAWVDAMYMANPERAKVLDLDTTKLTEYLLTAISKRIDYVNGKLADKRIWNMGFLPAWIHNLVDQIGIVENQDYGFRIKPLPVDFGTLTKEEFLAISNTVKIFKKDGIPLFDNWISRQITGNEDVMTMFIINERVKSWKIDAGFAAHLAVFLNNKLVDTTAMASFFRIDYGNANQFDYGFAARLSEMIFNDKA